MTTPSSKPSPIEDDDHSEVHTTFQQEYIPLIKHHLNPNSTFKSLIDKTDLRKTVVKDVLTRLGYKVDMRGRVRRKGRH